MHKRSAVGILLHDHYSFYVHLKGLVPYMPGASSTGPIAVGSCDSLAVNDPNALIALGCSSVAGNRLVSVVRVIGGTAQSRWAWEVVCGLYEMVDIWQRKEMIAAII